MTVLAAQQQSTFRVVLCGLLGIILFVLASGCATENIIWRSGPEPGWRWDGERVVGDQRLYVGIGSADNVLDEAQGRRLALTNAAERVGASLEQTIESEIEITAGGTGPAHEGNNEASEQVKAQIRATSQQIVRQLHPLEWCYERWKIRKGFLGLGRSFTKYKYFVQAGYPVEEYDRVTQSIIDKLERELNFLLMRIDDGLAANDVTSAQRYAARAVLHHPREFDAWWATYRVSRAAGDVRKAVKALEKAQSTAKDDKDKRLARAALNEARDALAQELQAEAEKAAGLDNNSEALRLLEEAWSVARNRTLRRIISSRYYEILAHAAAAELASQADILGLTTVALSTFTTSDNHTSAEAHALKEAIARQLKSHPKVELLTREVTDADARLMLDGQWQKLEEMRKELGAEKARLFLVGSLGEEISVRLANLNRAETTILASGCSLEAIQGRPDLPIWEAIDELIPPNEDVSFNVAVWTERGQYRIGDTVRIHFKTDRNCHVYLVDVGTSGSLYLLYPNGFHPWPAVVGGNEYVVPAANDDYEIPVGGPPGWEGLKMIATAKPLHLGIRMHGPAVEIDDAKQRTFVQQLARELTKLSWAAAQAVFLVR